MEQGQKVEINNTALRQVLAHDQIDAFKGLFKFDAQPDLSVLERARVFLDNLKGRNLKDSSEGAEPKERNILQFCADQGSSKILDFIVGQISEAEFVAKDEVIAIDAERLDGYYGIIPETFFDNPIAGNPILGLHTPLKIKLLMMAINKKQPQAVASLMTQLVDDIDADSYRQCLLRALEIDDFHLLNALVNNDVAKRLEKDLLPLHLLCEASVDYALIVERLSKDLDLNLADGNGNTPLHLAVTRKHKHTVGKIVQVADLNRKNADQLKPAQLAAKGGDFVLLKLLYKAGADLHSCKEILQSEIVKEDVEGIDSVKDVLKITLTKVEDLIKQGLSSKAYEAPDDSADSKYEYLCFKGGGIKGLAYLAAIIESIAQKLYKLKDIKGFAGTSAGSITAALLALRLPLEDLEEIMKNKDFTDFFDYHDPELVKTLLEQIKKGVDVWTVLKNYYVLRDTKVLLDTHLGACKGDNFYEWICGLITRAIENTPLKGIDPKHITFRDLRNNPDFFADLVVYGSNVNTGFPERYSFETTPDMCIADAIRISMSIPLIFDPHKKYIFKDGVRQLARKTIIEDGVPKDVPDEDLCVDGGLFYNYPAGAFDVSEAGEYQYNNKVLGYCLVEPDDHDHFELGKTRVGAELPKESVIRYILSLVYSTMFNQQSSDHQRGLDPERTIYINTRDIQTTEFGLSPERQQILLREGKEGVIKFIARQKNMPDKKLSSEVAKKLFSLGFLSSDKGVFLIGGAKKFTAYRVLKLYACAKEEELAFLKTIVNPNVLENGVSPLQVAQAYGYQNLVSRLLACNANPDLPRLTVQEVKERVGEDGLVDSRDEKLLMASKKNRLRQEHERLRATFFSQQNAMKARHEKRISDLQYEKGGLEKSHERKVKELGIEKGNLLQRHEEKVREFDMERGGLVREHEEKTRIFESEKAALEKCLTYQMGRQQYCSRLREILFDMSRFKDQYISDSSKLWFKGSGRDAAGAHCSHWLEEHVPEIMNGFERVCPLNVVLTEAKLKENFCTSLSELLQRLGGEDMLDIIANSSNDDTSYRAYVQKYRQFVSAELEKVAKELRSTPHSMNVSEETPLNLKEKEEEFTSRLDH